MCSVTDGGEDGNVDFMPTELLPTLANRMLQSAKTRFKMRILGLFQEVFLRNLQTVAVAQKRKSAQSIRQKRTAKSRAASKKSVILYATRGFFPFDRQSSFRTLCRFP